MRIISLCEKSGTSLIPWAMFGGYHCTCVDLQNDDHIKEFPSGGRINFVRADIRYWRPIDSNNVIWAFPPCTHLAVSGAKHFKNKGLKCLIDALTLVERCEKICEEDSILYAIENPVGTLSTYWREPDYYFQPNEYAGYLDGDMPIPRDSYTKKTCLWTSKNFVMPERKPIQAVKGSIVHVKLRDANERALFPLSFSYALYLYNKKVCEEQNLNETHPTGDPDSDSTM
jgi:hypothetical protein